MLQSSQKNLLEINHTHKSYQLKIYDDRWKTLATVSIHILDFILPVMAAVAVRKKVVSIGHFSPSSVKSNCMY